MFLIFDTETTGIPKNWNAPLSDSDNWPRMVQIAWQLHDKYGKLIEHNDFLIFPKDYDIPFEAEKIHGISTQLAQEKGKSLEEVIDEFEKTLKQTQFLVGQNLNFDLNIIGAEYYRLNKKNKLEDFIVLDTCTEKTAQLCQIKGGKGGKFKFPTLTELHKHLFNKPFEEAHNATADVEATARCFFELIRKGKGFKNSDFGIQNYFEDFASHHTDVIQPVGIKHTNLKEESKKLTSPLQEKTPISSEISQELQNATFVHLHNHSQYSILQSTTNINDLLKATVNQNMPAVALTDTANMMGTFKFINEITEYNESLENGKTPIKPIVGCEFNVCNNHQDKKNKDNGYQVVFLAKNKKGYHNLAKLSSISFTKGFYYVPRIDRTIIEEYKDEIIILTGGLNGEISNKILNQGVAQAEEALLWWKEVFNNDLYIELTDHGQEEEKRVNEVLIKFSKKHQIKTVATNNTFYTDKKDAETHDILLCIKNNEKIDTPIGKGRKNRFGFPNKEYYFKTAEQMKQIFSYHPESIFSISEILNKIENYTINRDVLLPKFSIPKQFKQENDPKGVKGENVYLKHLAYKGAKEHYGENISEDIKQRIDFELSVIEKTGYPGYFLIVWDFIAQARNMKVMVGPGRGSAAGSVVAYCLKITNIDPIKYNLLFERFLNPDRISMPDIDIDFDDEGRNKVIKYVIDKYGNSQVAQIITYGTMAARSSIRDTARVFDLPLDEAHYLANLVPKTFDLNRIFNEKDNNNLREDDLDKLTTIRKLAQQDNLTGKILNQAKIIEGTIRNTGTHPCGVIITPNDITNYIPVSLAKDSELVVSQYDNSVIENTGFLKMDFLGLSTLTLIKDTVKIIKDRTAKEIDLEKIPLDDKKTYELFQRGETTGIFQYESLGMQKYMKELKPTVFADLIAMNALYRPGPLEYIPSFIKRKHGKEDIIYDLEDCKEYLEETYGITVYQEQVMLLSQKLAGFTKGEADVLRKAMGKKNSKLLKELKPKFLKGGEERTHNKKKLEKIWKDWEAFASYAFNKSHSTCYAWIGYQTAYLKANYPEEFMAAVLSNNLNDIEKITFFLNECNRMNIKILNPDVNESQYRFTVNKDNAIRIGLGAVKRVGKYAIDTIIEHRAEKPYQNIFDLVKKINLRSANKKTLESLALSGAFDSFKNADRHQYLHTYENGETFIEKVMKFGQKYQENKKSTQLSLFGDEDDTYIQEPSIPDCAKWGTLEKLAREKEVVGISVSGHPLDDYKYAIKYCTNADTNLLNNSDLNILANKKEFSMGGVIDSAKHLVSKKGNKWGIFNIVDYFGNYEFKIFGKEYLEFAHLLNMNQFIFIKLKIEQRGWGDKKTPNVVCREIELLKNVLEKKAKRIIINLNLLDDVEKEKIKTLKHLFSNYQGDKQLSFNIKTKEDDKELSINMLSKNTQLTINSELLESLENRGVNFLVE